MDSWKCTEIQHNGEGTLGSIWDVLLQIQAKDTKQIALIAATLARKCIRDSLATQIQRAKDSTYFSFSLCSFMYLQIITGNSTNYFQLGSWAYYRKDFAPSEAHKKLYLFPLHMQRKWDWKGPPGSSGTIPCYHRQPYNTNTSEMRKFHLRSNLVSCSHCSRWKVAPEPPHPSV